MASRYGPRGSRRVGPPDPERVPTLERAFDTVGRGAMRVLGVDPGLTRCGIGVVAGAPGRSLHLVHVEVVRTPAEADIGRRLLAQADAVAAALQRWAPDVVAVERVFS